MYIIHFGSRKLAESAIFAKNWLIFLISQVWTYASHEVVTRLILIRMVKFLFKICIFCTLGYKNWLNQSFLLKTGRFFGFANLVRLLHDEVITLVLELVWPWVWMGFIVCGVLCGCGDAMNTMHATMRKMNLSRPAKSKKNSQFFAKMTDSANFCDPKCKLCIFWKESRPLWLEWVV